MTPFPLWSQLSWGLWDPEFQWDAALLCVGEEWSMMSPVVLLSQCSPASVDHRKEKRTVFLSICIHRGDSCLFIAYEVKLLLWLPTWTIGLCSHLYSRYYIPSSKYKDLTLSDNGHSTSYSLLLVTVALRTKLAKTRVKSWQRVAYILFWVNYCREFLWHISEVILFWEIPGSIYSMCT